MITDFLKKKKTDYSYFDLPLEERRKISDNAAREANKEQYKVVKEYESSLAREKASSRYGK